MDGGGIIFDENNFVHPVWQREGVVYYDQPGQFEIRISEGRSCGIYGSQKPFITCRRESQIFGKPLDGGKVI